MRTRLSVGLIGVLALAVAGAPWADSGRADEGRKAEAAAAPHNCCVTGDCCCPLAGECCDPALRARAEAAPRAAQKGPGCCVTGDCCCPGRGVCCAPAARARKTCCAAPAQEGCCER
jgi:hypothetical protein